MKSNEQNLYLETACFFDDATLWPDDDLPFYQDLIQKAGAGGKKLKILEAGCGTGRASLPLASKRKDEWTVFDYSEPMLKELRLKIQNYPDEFLNRFRIEKQDMTDFHFEDCFDFILFPFRSFQVLDSAEKRQQCLNSVFRHSHSKTKIIIHACDLDEEEMKTWVGCYELNRLFTDRTGRKMRRLTHGIHYDADQRRFQYEFIFEIDDHRDHTETYREPLSVSVLSHREYLKLFSENGFKVLNSYSNWKKDPVSKYFKDELIYILQPKLTEIV